MKRAAIYARKSKLTEKGDSIDNQINLCKGYLANLGIDDYVIYKDEGFSGKNIDRPKFTELIKDARDKKFNILICYKLDRISRNVADFSTLVSELETLGVSFISVNEQFDTSNAMGKAMMLICSVFSQLERETISIRVRDNMYALAEKGNWLGGEVPMGFKNERISFTDEGGKERSYCILLPVENKEIKTTAHTIAQNTTMINNLINNVSMISDQNTAKIFMDKITALTNKNNELTERMNMLKEQLSAEENKSINHDKFILQLKYVAAFINSCDLKEKRKLISSVVHKVYADGTTGTITLQLKR